MIASWLESLLLFGIRLLTGVQAHWPADAGEGSAFEDRQRIYCANHSSHLDFLLLSACFPSARRRRIRPVAAAEYWTAGPLRRYLSGCVFRSVLIERERRSLNPLEPVLEALRRGDSLIFFPEGARGPGESLQPLKPGIFHIARAFPPVDIVPVWIDNSYRIMPKGFFFPVPLLCSATFGTPIRWDGEEEAGPFLARLREAMEGARPQ
jgi:1-acyl-sn-glycerol-3-phosphate acyltransferase